MTIIIIRFLISTFLLFLILTVSKQFVKIGKGHFKLFFWLAVCEPFLYFLSESHGLTFISATVGSVIVATIPVVISLAAWIFLKEKLSLINYTGIALSFVGVVIFVLANNGSTVTNPIGIVLMLFAVLAAVGYGVFLGKLIHCYTPLFIVFVQNIIGTLLFLPVFLISDIGHLPVGDQILAGLAPTIKLAIFSTVGSFVLFAIAVKEIGVARANVFTNFIPVLTAIFSFFIFSEQLSSRSITGMVVVVCGLLLAQLKIKKQIIEN
jgi:drug/metabolite transporter (DMT)-like permease